MGMNYKTMWQVCGAIGARGDRFRRAVPLTPLVLAAMLVLPQLMYPLHFVQKNYFDDAGHDGCCHSVCAHAPQDEDRDATPSLTVSSDHDGGDCTLCLAYKLTGGHKTLRAAPFRCILPHIAHATITADIVMPPLLFAAHCSAPRAPPLLFVS